MRQLLVVAPSIPGRATDSKGAFHRFVWPTRRQAGRSDKSGFNTLAAAPF
jgi:hypothetical protein